MNSPRFFQFLLVIIFSAGFIYNCSGHNLKPVKDKKEKPDDAKIEAARFSQKASRLLIAGDFDGAIEAAQSSVNFQKTPAAYYMLGYVYFKKGETEKAFVNWDEGIKLDPKHNKTLLRAVHAAHQIGDDKRAINYYEKLLANNPDESVYRIQLGALYRDHEKYDKAVQTVQPVPESYKDYVVALIIQSEVAAAQGDFNKAKSLAAKAKAANPNHPALKNFSQNLGAKSSLVKAKKALLAGNYNQALATATLVHKKDKKNVTALVIMGQAELAKKNYGKAQANAKKAIALHPDSVDAYIVLIGSQKANGELKAAFATIDGYVKEFGPNADMLNFAGVVSKEAGRMRQALSFFHQAVKERPAFGIAYANIGYTNLEMDRFDDAAKAFDKAVAFPVNNELTKKWKQEALLAKGLAFKAVSDEYLVEKQYTKALTEIDKAINLRPDLPLFKVAKGKIYFLANNTGQAESFFNKAIEQDIKYAPAYLAKLVLYQTNLKKYNEEYKNTRDTIDEYANSEPGFAGEMGRAAMVDNDEKVAEAYFKKCLQLDSEFYACKRSYAKLKHRQGNRFSNKGNFAQALARLAQAKELDPANQKINLDYETAQENKKFQYLYPRINLARKYYRQKKFAAAKAQYKFLYAKLPRSGFLISLANCHFSLGEEKEGFEILHEGRSKFKDNLEFLESINSYYLKRGDDVQALRGFNKIKKKFPQEAYAYYKTGIIFLRKQKFTRAADDFDEAILRDPAFGEAYIGRGIAFFKQGFVEKARLDFIQGRNFERSAVLGYENLGLSHIVKSEMKLAKSVFTDLQEKYPKEEVAYYYLAYLKYLENDIKEATQLIRKSIRLNENLRNLLAFSRILEGQYNKTKKPQFKTRLIRLYRKILKTPGAAAISATVRAKLMALANQKTFVEVFNPDNNLGDNPVKIGSNIIFKKRYRISVHDWNTKVRRWARSFRHRVLKFSFSEHLYVLTEKELYVYHLGTGRNLKRYKLTTPAARGGWVVNTQFFYLAKSEDGFQLIRYNLLTKKGNVLMTAPMIKATTSGGLHSLIAVGFDKATGEIKSSIGVDKKQVVKWMKETEAKSIKMLHEGMLLIGKKKGIWYLPGLGAKEFDRDKNFRSVFTHRSKLYLLAQNSVTEISSEGTKDFDAPKGSKPLIGFVRGEGEEDLLFCDNSGHAFIYKGGKVEKVRLYYKWKMQKWPQYTQLAVYTIE